MKIFKIIFLTLYLFLFASLSFAEPVKLSNASSKTVVADYLQGTNNANPVILLHGFLQTNEFPTVSRLESALHDSGYTVLNPTLSLGLSNRKQSLSCEAIHTHSLASDADELKLWINWLYKKTGRPVTIIGHSAGGPVVLKYMQDNNAKYMDHTILISLSYYASGPTANETQAHAETALKAINSGSNPLGSYALDYCKTYPTYASAFLSYYNWNRAKVSSAVSQFNDRISVIIGTGDKRIDSDWHQQLKKKHNNVILIEGANHFFDQAYEFDLTDTIENLLTEKMKR